MCVLYMSIVKSNWVHKSFLDLFSLARLSKKHQHKNLRHWDKVQDSNLKSQLDTHNSFCLLLDRSVIEKESEVLVRTQRHRKNFNWFVTVTKQYSVDDLIAWIELRGIDVKLWKKRWLWIKVWKLKVSWSTSPFF